MKRKTDKNIIIISGKSTIEDILTTIGAHLLDISSRYTVDSFCDIGFYFKTHDGMKKFVLADEEGYLQEWRYKGRSPNKKITYCVSDVFKTQQKPAICYDEISERISKATKIIAEERKKKIEEWNIKQQKIKEKEESERKRIEKQTYFKGQASQIKDNYIKEQNIVSSKSITVHAITSETGSKTHFPNGLPEDLELPFYSLKHGNIKIIYDKNGILKYTKTL